MESFLTICKRCLFSVILDSYLNVVFPKERDTEDPFQLLGICYGGLGISHKTVGRHQ